MGWWLLFCGLSGLAQTAVDGAVAGRVVRDVGASMAGVRVEARLLGEGKLAAKREAAVGRDGTFVMLRLEPGEYQVEASLLGRVVASERVAVALGEVSEVELRERVLAATASTPLNAAAGRMLVGEEQRLQDAAGGALRVNAFSVNGAGLSVAEVSAADAGALGAREADVSEADVSEADERVADSTREDSTDERAERRQSGTNASVAALLSFRGLSPTQNVSLLDGVSSDQEFRGGGRGSAPGGPRSATNFGEGSVRAFRVAPHNYEAQYGGAASGLLTTASRSGGTALHGGGFYKLRGSALDAANPFSLVTRYRDGVVTNSLVKPQDLLQQVGVRVGGPVLARALHDRVTGFASVEQQWRSFPAMASPVTTPAAAAASQANFYALTPTQVALLGNRGVGRAATQTALNYLDGLTGEVSRRADRGLQFGRLDWRAGARDRFAVSYARGRLNSPAGTGSGASTAVVARGAASVGDETIRTDAVTGRWLRMFSARVTNEVRGQYSHDLEFERARAPLAQEPGIGPGGFAPEVAIGGGEFLFGTPAALGRNAYPDETRLQVADLAQWSVGRHLLTMGGDWSRIDERIDALTNVDGTFTYDSGTTNGRAGGLVDWITDFTFNVRVNPNGGCPSINAALHLACFRSYTQSFGQQAVAFRMHSFAGFAQDVWRVRPGLTVEVGARYEYTLLPLPQSPNTVLDAAFAGVGATSTFPEDRNNVGPRIALAWAAKWGTARVGYGAYFGRLPGSTVRAALVDTALPAGSQTAGVTRIRITPQTVTACPQVANQGFGFPCAYVSMPPAAIAATTSAMLFAKNFRLPVVQQAEMTLERGIGSRAVLRATYSMALATQLPNSADVNIAASAGLKTFVLQGGDGRVGVQDGEPFVVPAYTARVSTQFGPVTAIESNANATWHGLTVGGQVLGWAGVRARGSYTWSKALDFGAEQGTTPRVNGQFDPFNVRYDKGRADADFPQRFTGDAVWETRWRRGPRAVQQALTGWRVTALATAGSGRPYSYEIFGGTRLSGGAESINGAGGASYLPTVGRNTLRLPVRWSVDARVTRGFRVTDKLRGEGYVEAFNVANHVNAARVNARAFLVGTAVGGVTPLVFQSAAAVALEGLNTPAFGTVTSSTAGSSQERTMQVGVRLEF